MRRAIALGAVLSLVACGDPPAATQFELVGASHWGASGWIELDLHLMDAAGSAAGIARTTIEVELIEHSADAPSGHGRIHCSGSSELQRSELNSDGAVHTRVRLDVGTCVRATPGNVAEIRVTVRSPAGATEPRSILAPAELQPEPGAVPPPEPLFETAESEPPPVTSVLPPPTTTVAPAGAGVVCTPYPIALDGIVGTLDHDPEDARATIVRTEGAEVRVAETHGMPGEVLDGAHMQAQLEHIGATFTTSETTAADRWALAYTLGGHFGVQCGLVLDGHTYVCRGDYADASTQARALAVCRTMRGTGGAAAPLPTGVIVGSCVHGTRCAQVHAMGETVTTEAVLQLADTCGMVGEIVTDRPCAATLEGFPSEGRCITPQGIDWVYYQHEQREECATIGGTYVRP